jgi:GNAT superfamily N-acetyltransferase
MSYNFRPAVVADVQAIWEILRKAIIRRRNEGSQQWQDGYPNQAVIETDIQKNAAYVLCAGAQIVGYSAVLINDEPAYQNIEGAWLTSADFMVIHRVAIAETELGKGLAGLIFSFVEQLALAHNIHSIRVDTNFDNAAMLRVLEKAGYSFCGQVYLRGNPRKAFEKKLD